MAQCVEKKLHLRALAIYQIAAFLQIVRASKMQKDADNIAGYDEPTSPYIVVVVPAYNEAAQILDVLTTIPECVQTVVVVDDGSTDDTLELVESMELVDPRIELIRHDTNRGVGAAMVTGFRRALKLGAEIVVKMDADGQMSAGDLPTLVQPLLDGRGDFAKGNRFRDFAALETMPPLRRMGNLVLSFFTKAAVGYWNCFDPCNGYVAIRGDVLESLPLERLQDSFFFETSLLAELNLLNAVVVDVPMAARYGAETSHLSIRKVLREFPGRLARCLVRRLWLKNFMYDFSMQSVYLLAGMLLAGGGIGYGGIHWLTYAWAGIGAPTGTVVIPAMMIILGFQSLLSAVNEDIRRVPTEPLWRRLSRNGNRTQLQWHANSQPDCLPEHETTSATPETSVPANRALQELEG